MANRTLYGPQVKYNSTDAQRQQQMAQLLLKEGVDTSPVRGGWGEALARIGTAGIGGYLSNQAGETEKAYAADRAKTLAAALSGNDPNQAANTLLANPSTADLGTQLAVGNMTFNRDRAAKKEDTADERGFRKEMFGMERQSRLEDIGLSQNFQREMAQIQQAFQSGQMTAQQAFQAAENAKSREQQMQVAQMSRVPAGYQPTDTGMQAIPGGPADPSVVTAITAAQSGSKPATEGERNAAGFAGRALDAEKVIRQFENINQGAGGATGAALGAVRGLGMEMAANAMSSPERQQFVQAQRQFTEARLRKESGAAIPKQEYESDAITYFPQPGDSAETVARKRQARNEVIESLKLSAGKATPAASGAIKFLGFE